MSALRKYRGVTSVDNNYRVVDNCRPLARHSLAAHNCQMDTVVCRVFVAIAKGWRTRKTV